MINKTLAEKLFSNYIHRQKPVMVHGTSAQEVIKMFQTGFLESSKTDEDKGYLHFVPRKKAFKKHELYYYVSNSLNVSRIKDECKVHAKNVQEVAFLSELLDYWPKNIYLEDIKNEKFTFRELKDNRIDINKVELFGLRNLINMCKTQKGVYLGINEKIFELNIEEGKNNYGKEVSIYLPKGLDIKYVGFITPFGKLQQNYLNEWIENNLK